MKEEQQVPPGIVRFKTKEGTLYFQYPHSDYDNWVRFHLTEGSTIHTILVENKEWSVGEEICTVYATMAKIEKFSYENNEWRAEVRGGETFGKWHIPYLTKVSPPPSQQDRSVSQPGKEDKIYSQSEMDAAIYNVTELAEFCKNKEFEQYRQQLENLTKENYNLKKSQPSQPGDGKGENEKQHDRNSKDWDLWNSALKANASSEKSLEQLLYEGEISGFHRKPPLPEQGKEGKAQLFLSAYNEICGNDGSDRIITDSYISGWEAALKSIPKEPSEEVSIDELRIAFQDFRKNRTATKLTMFEYFTAGFKLKSRPSEGWSDETLLKDFTYWLGEKQYPITALIHFKEFLSSYKAKQTKS